MESLILLSCFDDNCMQLQAGLNLCIVHNSLKITMFYHNIYFKE